MAVFYASQKFFIKPDNQTGKKRCKNMNELRMDIYNDLIAEGHSPAEDATHAHNTSR